MPTTAVFEQVADCLERETGFERLAARGTVRLALRHAGLDARTVSVPEMLRVIDLHLPGELECRGVEAARAVCTRIRAELASRTRDALEAGSSSLFAHENLGKPR